MSSTVYIRCVCHDGYLCDESAGHFEVVLSNSQVEGGASTLLLRGVDLSPALHQQTQTALSSLTNSQVERMET